jgi:hypothetical protein
MSLPKPKGDAPAATNAPAAGYGVLGVCRGAWLARIVAMPAQRLWPWQRVPNEPLNGGFLQPQRQSQAATRFRVVVLGRPVKFRSTSMRSAALIRDW